MNLIDWLPPIFIGSFFVCLGRIVLAGRALGRCLRGKDAPAEDREYTAPGPRCNTLGGFLFLFSSAARAWAAHDPAFAQARKSLFRAWLWFFPGWPVFCLLALVVLAWLARGGS